MYNYPGMSFLMVIIIHIVTSYPIYLLSKKAGYKDAIFAFIPIFNIILLLNVAGMSGWWTLVLIFIPLINVLLGLYVTFRFFAGFESGVGVFAIIIFTAILGTVIPFVSIIGTLAVWWLALSENDYIGELYEN
ncbi:DUF5684 domain-containing protein [Alkaliphilus hydrothermalis]|uniref:Uncharacterized protein n=1 Tax=Alkaliphilus hydrothermalis TaxID=1482730 RepID=A0ABS2NS03_9FIRM|nr:DUF5684 domain-containing protein [Alkaliphilus hydrothermalis]MBM7615718.1 hypothetical protein [Alkaliphilus hydrothermalis]